MTDFRLKGLERRLHNRRPGWTGDCQSPPVSATPQTATLVGKAVSNRHPGWTGDCQSPSVSPTPQPSHSSWKGGG